jgi:hypothetical protein
MDKDIKVTLEKKPDIDWWPDFCMSLRKMPNISKACRAAGGDWDWDILAW